MLQATGYNLPVPVRHGALQSNELTLTIKDNDGDAGTETPLQMGVLDTFTGETGNTKDNTVRIPAQTGQRFRTKLDTDSGGNWTLIPDQSGQ